MIIKVLRNVLSVLIGLITYLVIETLSTYVFFFLLKIPVLSFLMTSYIPKDIFLSATVASTAGIATFYIIKLISSYKSTNYSVIVVFSILLIVYMYGFIHKLFFEGIDFTKLSSALIHIGSLIFGAFMAKEET